MRARARARLEEAIAREIADILEFEVKDPVLREALPTVLGAELSPDGQEAKIRVYISGTEEERARVMAAFAKDTGFLRSALAKRLPVRRVPRLSFALDTSPDRWAEPSP
ncbi:MAG: 30S ribosome-binding factor RbfA [Candidatus Bipolaricaulaceae bacterium]